MALLRSYLNKPPSGTLIASKIISHETPTPATDGAQTSFTVANEYVAGSLQVFLDGLNQIPTTDFTETDSTHFEMVAAPDADEVLWVYYIKV